jgi:hypothetical protein
MSISLRNYGYSTKKEYNERMDAVERAIEEYDVQKVYERLVKLGEFNPVMKEDAESVARIYELFSAFGLKVEEPKSIWVAMRPEVDKGVRLSKSCKDAPKMVTAMGDYGVQDNAHVRMQLLLDLADKHGIFAVLSLMATHLVTLTNPDQKQIIEGDMSALTTIYNERMKAKADAEVEAGASVEAEEEAEAEAEAEASVEAEAEAVVEAVVEAEVSVEEKKEKKEKKELFLEMLNVKFAKYKHELCCLLDVEDADISFESVYESVVNAYNEKVQKDNKIMEQKIQEFSKTSKIFEKYRDTIVHIISKDYEYKQYSSLRNMLTEMSFSEEQIVQDILNLMISVLKEHKQCQIISVSELEKRQQVVLRENGKMMTEISEMVKKKNVAISECDIEGYDILTSTIISHYKKVLSMHVDGLVYEIRLRDIKSSLRGIPSDMF